MGSKEIILMNPRFGEFERVHAIFSQIDKDHDGEITAVELRDALQEIGLSITTEQAIDLFESVDLGPSKGVSVTLEEFFFVVKQLAASHGKIGNSVESLNLRDIGELWLQGNNVDMEGVLQPMAEKDQNLIDMLKSLAAGGTAGALAKTIMCVPSSPFAVLNCATLEWRSA